VGPVAPELIVLHELCMLPIDGLPLGAAVDEAASTGTMYPAELWAFTDRTLYDDEPQSILADSWYGVRGQERRSLLDL
jgi:hypothetical protein